VHRWNPLILANRVIAGDEGWGGLCPRKHRVAPATQLPSEEAAMAKC
jgi:hypothetical protein